MPCSGDDVIVPDGYSARMIAYGRQLRRRFGSYTSSGDLVWAETRADLPVYFHSPDGASLDMLLSGDVDNAPAPLIQECYSTCIATDDTNPLAYINEPGRAAARIRDQTRDHAQAALDHGDEPVSDDFVFSYHGVADRLDVSEQCANRISVLPAEHMPPGTSIDNVSVTASADNDGTITVTGRFSGTVGMLHALERELAGTPFDVTNRPETLEGLLYYPVFHSVIASAASSDGCDVVGAVSALWQSAGLQTQLLHVYTGSTLPQADVPNLVNQENVAPYGIALFNGLAGAYGMVGLDQGVLEGGLDDSPLTSPRMIAASRSGRFRRFDQVNYGRASTLVKVTLSFEAYGEVTWDSPAGRAIEARADMITGLFPFSPPQATQCWDYDLGYNVSCIRAAVTDGVLAAMNSTQACVADLRGTECTALAAASGRDVWDRVVGCGAMGVNRDGLCTDPMFRSDGSCPAVEVTMFTNMTCDALDETALALSGGGDDDDAGMGMLMIVIIAAAGLIVCIIVVAILVVSSTAKNKNAPDAGYGMRKPPPPTLYEDGTGTTQARRNTNVAHAFENPMYGGGNGNQSSGADDIDDKFNKLRMSVDEGLYDDPETFDEPQNKSNPTYSSNEDLAAGDDLYDNNTVDVDGGGYLDVVPDDGDDESDDEEDDEDDEDEDADE